jgi:hypothetical protein
MLAFRATNDPDGVSLQAFAEFIDHEGARADVLFCVTGSWANWHVRVLLPAEQWEDIGAGFRSRDEAVAYAQRWLESAMMLGRLMAGP